MFFDNEIKSIIIIWNITLWIRDLIMNRIRVAFHQFFFFLIQATVSQALKKNFSSDSINVSADLFDSSVEDMTLLPPSGFSDSRELSDVECDRDRDRERDREWQGLSAGTRHGGSLGRLPIEAVESMLARYRHEYP